MPRDFNNENELTSYHQSEARALPVKEPAATGDAVLDVLVKAREWLSDPANWCKGTGIDGGGRACMIGGIVKTAHRGNFGNFVIDPAINCLSAALPNRAEQCVPQFNDALGTTHADIMGVFDRAISARKAQT